MKETEASGGSVRARPLGEALAGQAELFVTGDAVLQGFAAVGALKIVSPRQLWEMLRGSNE